MKSHCTINVFSYSEFVDNPVFIRNQGKSQGIPTNGAGNPRASDSSALTMTLDNQISGSGPNPSHMGRGLMSSTHSQKIAPPTPDVVVGKGAHIIGNVTKTKSMVISGMANITASDLEYLNVTAEGTLSGDITVNDASIEGDFTGKMVVKGRLTVRAGATIKADIVYKRIEIESGAIFSGNISQAESFEKAIPLTMHEDEPDNGEAEVALHLMPSDSEAH